MREVQQPLAPSMEKERGGAKLIDWLDELTMIRAVLRVRNCEGAVTVRATLPCGVGSFSSLCSRVSGTYVIVAGRRTSPEATRPAIRPPRIAASVPATGTGMVPLTH